MITLLPEDVLVECIARVPKHNYSTLSLVCKLFRSIVTSHELYTRRSLLGCTETCIYVPISNIRGTFVRWYTLNLTTRCLVLVPSLPPMPLSNCRARGGYVVVGSRIFALGGHNNGYEVATIDCRYDNVAKPFGNMPKMFTDARVSNVGEKLYVIGDCQESDDKWPCLSVMVLDMEAKTWEYDTMSTYCQWPLARVTMDDKIYIKCFGSSIVFEPRDGTCEDEETLNSSWRGENGCVIEGILYNYDTTDNCLRAYDLKKRLSCGVVKGVELLVKNCCKANVVSCGENLILLTMEEIILNERRVIWCGEIALLGRNQIGEMHAKVEWFQPMLDGDVYFLDCLSVIV